MACCYHTLVVQRVAPYLRVCLLIWPAYRHALRWQLAKLEQLSRRKRDGVSGRNMMQAILHSQPYLPPLADFFVLTTYSRHNARPVDIRRSQFHFYRQLKRRGQAPLHREWIGAAAEPGEAVTSNSADTDEFLSAAVAGFLG